MARTKDFDEKEVLNKALCLFWHKGYNATSMQDLVDQLGISRSSLYDTYGDKHTLYVKALEAYQGAGDNRMCDILNGSGPAKEQINQLLMLIISDLINDENSRGCFMVNAEVEVAPHDAEVKDIICKSELQLENAFFKAIQKGQESGEISSKQAPRALARFLHNTVKGIQVSAKSTTDKAFFDDIIQTALSVLG